MKNYFKKAALFLLAVMCAGCATTSKGVVATGGDRSQGGAPVWVTDVKAAYPESEWLTAVETASTKDMAASKASSSLAAIFKVDVKGVATAMQNISSFGGGAYSKSMGLDEQIQTTVDVAGLMGVLHDSWTGPDGKEWSCARMNRKSGTETYTALIKDNAGNINTLIADAAKSKGTFDAYQTLGFAYNLAIITDNYMDLLSVLNTAARNAIKFDYGNAASVRALIQNAAAAVVVNVTVTTDTSGRIAKAFSEVFTARGFRTSSSASTATYILKVTFKQSDVDLPQNPNKFVRYEITASLTDSKTGKEAVNFSANDRSGHSNVSEARQRSLRDAEKKITDTTDEDGFAVQFDGYIASLLK
ncbi:hypothetical protein FACS1894190_10790 [Spirochaetia bacterium]|nr:hypothetical protein FACS1894190_10790 [Spirochaetia bacterium]